MTELRETIYKSMRLAGYKDTVIRQYGICHIDLQFKSKRINAKFFVIDQCMTLIGLTDSIKLSLITVNFFDSVSNTGDKDTKIKTCDSSEYFSGNAENKCQDKVTSDQLKTAIIRKVQRTVFWKGKLEGEINITLKPNMVPCVAPVCRMAHSLQEPFKQELDKLIKQGIVVPLGTDKPSKWVNSFVCIRKLNGKIRLCLDLTQLNKFIGCPHHDSKLVEDLLPNLSVAKVFSTVDTCSSFFMMLLNKHSSYLTTFATMYGRFRNVHVPMGASLSSDCFQYKMDEIFGPIKQCCDIADNLIVFGYSEEDHDRVLFVV